LDCRAISASAPVAQFSAPCDAFGRIVTSDYSANGKECSDVIRKSWAAVDNLTASGKATYTALLSGIVLCFALIQTMA
jgi:hypothetical protein